jgi:Low-density lipoprotein receptor repeat class B
MALDGAHIYWSNQGSTSTIGRANIDGSGANQSFISGAKTPEGMAVDAGHVYWVNNGLGEIGRANLDGSGVEQAFVADAGNPTGMAVDRLPRRATTTAVDCAPALLSPAAPASCTATVSEAGSLPAIVPTGTVGFSSSGPGAFSPSTSCVLVATGERQAACQVTFTPALAGAVAVSGSYEGDSLHLASNGATALQVQTALAGPVPAPVGLAAPSNAFSVARAKLNPKTGGATVTATVHGAGNLVLKGGGVKRAAKRAARAGKVTLAIKPSAGTRAKLAAAGKATVAIEVTFTPDGGKPRTRKLTVALKLAPASK